MKTKYARMIEDFNLYGITLSDYQIEQFNKYYELLIKWNEVMNLTAITDFDEICKLHFVDSISSCQFFDFKDQEYSVIDIGTGAGFPGIPLKIVFPNLHVTLFDSLNKRLKFLDEVITTLNLNECGSIKTLHGRAEDFASTSPDSLREKYDIAISRAVANMSTLSEYCLPYVKVNGKFIAYKSDKLSDELLNAKGAIHLLGGKINSINDFVLPDTDIKRTICIVDKVEKTSKKYPRKAGVPSKQPL
ncbi:16S rRNA (guanine(527)-N(7))-methyltransferase RsmG [Butyrivibrio sp. YAB3001]|uniref:16S rRNA (guanine(527)-N(7))-methyltransferase RsmG n=1 Tax=Butyrivibrio sp. YAB3001 TaxID=1520812 RepID=UPI0008F666B6|nr:16S rRNA (guanine(527)-N(7))-methyltransferase RsmG [Butyrivibrio sp. YAB3001]SFC85271.1 16S rRNA (guanine527-N7)-methyltransferase [Butyrivibrio sp. YAB3001]